MLYGLLRRLRGRDDGWNSVIGGGVAGLALLIQEKENRRTVSLYLLVRLCQCIYNELKRRNLWHFWQKDWPHGDSLLFVLSSAQVSTSDGLRGLGPFFANSKGRSCTPT